MTQITIEHANGGGRIKVDGHDLSGVLSAQVVLAAGSLPVVEVRLAATEHSMKFADGKLVVYGLEAPEALERALLDYLCQKYPNGTAFARLFASINKK